jgi:uncharacterized membrane protein
MDSTFRTILGLPFLLFIPGYILILALFPMTKENKRLNNIERVALSFGFSIAIDSLLGFILNFTPWQIRLEPILLLLFFFIVVVGFIAFLRWKAIPLKQRFVISFDVTLPKSNNTSDNVLTIILCISIIISAAIVGYVIVTPKIGETFTEFYILGPTRNTTGYPRNLSVDDNANVIIGLVNHEYKIMNYTIEVWLINQTIFFNESTQKNETIYNEMWYIDKMTINLNPIDNIKQLSGWEKNYSFSLNKKGEFKLTFLLFITPTGKYDFNTNYKNISEQKFESAYKELHLWLSVE